MLFQRRITRIGANRFVRIRVIRSFLFIVFGIQPDPVATKASFHIDVSYRNQTMAEYIDCCLSLLQNDIAQERLVAIRFI